jgi:hypothetical protein
MCGACDQAREQEHTAAKRDRKCQLEDARGGGKGHHGQNAGYQSCLESKPQEEKGSYQQDRQDYQHFKLAVCRSFGDMSRHNRIPHWHDDSSPLIK